MEIFLDPVQVLLGPNQSVYEDSVLIRDHCIIAFGKEARNCAKELGIKAKNAKEKILAPCLVDPHSRLDEPFYSSSQTLESLSSEAAMAGYGQIALLPTKKLKAERLEHLQAIHQRTSNVIFHLWANFSKEGDGLDLSSHHDLLEIGAVGLVEDETIPPTNLLKKGLVLGEIGNAPLLIAPIDKELQRGGFVRETVEALRSGLPVDPYISELMPVNILLTLQTQHPEVSMRLMNISTAESVAILKKNLSRPLSTVSWWHLVADTSSLNPTSIGWKVSPSLGSLKDKDALITGLHEKILTGVSVQAIPLDHTEVIKPINERVPGVSGHKLVLPMLWNTLVMQRKWSIEELWEAISFGPSKILKKPPEQLKVGSNRWLLFNPNQKWVEDQNDPTVISPSNYPSIHQKISGCIECCGLIQEVAQSD